MARLTTMLPLQFLLVTLLCLGLWSCAGVDAKPPEAAVTAAIAQKLERTQSLLARQLALAEGTLANPRVDQVIIAHYHWTTLEQHRVVQVQGTYHLKGGSLSRSQQRQNRPFEVYLERREAQDGNDGWVEIEPTPASELS